MATTQLSPIAVPGGRYSFAAKGVATGPHTGLFTELSVAALPGPRRSFAAKGGVAVGPHTGLFTDLSVIALPGARQSFSAKGAVVIPEAPEEAAVSGIGVGGMGVALDEGEYRIKPYAKPTAKRHRDDKDLLELAAMIVKSGILD